MLCFCQCGRPQASCYVLLTQLEQVNLLLSFLLAVTLLCGWYFHLSQQASAAPTLASTWDFKLDKAGRGEETKKDVKKHCMLSCHSSSITFRTEF